jgi:septum formation protein
VLASGSPRRRELLTGLDLAFTLRPGDVDESPHAGETPESCVRRLALAKAAAAAGAGATTAEGAAGELVLAADTLVVLDGRMLGKPRDRADARQMLASIAGREHTVLTGVALLEAPHGRQAATVEESRVRMAPMTPAELDWYVATGEPLDKAGSYAVQGKGGLFVEAVYGNYTNVVGLPLPATYRLFASLGYDLRRFGTLSPRT